MVGLPHGTVVLISKPRVVRAHESSLSSAFSCDDGDFEMGISVTSNPLFTDSHQLNSIVALLLSANMLPSSGPMKASSGVLESPRAA